MLDKDYIKFTMDEYVAKRLLNKEDIYSNYITFKYDELNKEIVAYISEE